MKNGEFRGVKIFTSCADSILMFNGIIYEICILSYGRIAVDLANKSMVLVGIDSIGEHSKRTVQENQNIFKAHIYKVYFYYKI